jgi:hypothetical protein
VRQCNDYIGEHDKRSLHRSKEFVDYCKVFKFLESQGRDTPSHPGSKSPTGDRGRSHLIGLDAEYRID